MRILTNNPKKIHGLAGYGLELVDQMPLEPAPNASNIKYLRTKRDKLGHMLREVELPPQGPAGQGSSEADSGTIAEGQE